MMDDFAGECQSGDRPNLELIIINIDTVHRIKTKDCSMINYRLTVSMNSTACHHKVSLYDMMIASIYIDLSEYGKGKS